MVYFNQDKGKENKEMMKRREFNTREEAGKFFYGISKMAEVAYKSYNVKAEKYVVEWKWDKKYFEKNK